MKIEIAGIQYYWEVCGNGKPLVCLHGFAEDHTTWKNFQLQGYSLYKIDLIGHGQTDAPPEKYYYELPVLLEHLRQILREIVPEDQYALLGYSMGGRLALAYALTYPEEVAEIILESSSWGIGDLEIKQARLKQDQGLAEKILLKGINWFQSYWAELPIFASQKKLPKPVWQEIQQRRRQNSALALANTLWGTGQGVFPYYGEQVKSFERPILYICGSLDAKYRALGQQMAAANSRICCKIMDGVGHNVHLEAPEAYQKTVQEFLKKSERGNFYE